jgi:epoxyqueuosine reductase
VQAGDDVKSAIRAAARKLGFARCGFARVQRPPHAAFVEQWVAQGRAAGMDYIGRRLARRLDPTRILAGARTIISVAMPYRPPPPPPVDWRATLRGRIAAYAAEPDYHKAMGARLRCLQGFVKELCPGERALWYVDTGAILEREWASLGGLGWFGKNTNLLHQLQGSWFFLGELISTIDVAPDEPVSDRCGTCTACLDLCPTGALLPGYVLDARQCISYWTIEHRGVIPVEMRPRLGAWIFGCDECQEVCPWNDKLAPDGDVAQRERLTPYLPGLVALDDSAFEALFRGTSLWRLRREGLARNAAVALGNTGNPAAVDCLADALRGDPSPVVRGHAAWALGRIDDRRARSQLDRRRSREPDPRVEEEITGALEQRWQSVEKSV